MWTKEKNSNSALHGPNTTSFFAPGFRMIGDIDSTNDVRVEGIIQGNITTSKKIIVGKSGQIIGNAKASQISIMGEIVGEVIATDIVVIGETGVVHGTIVCNKIKIDEGAGIEACIKKLKSQTENESKNPMQHNSIEKQDKNPQVKTENNKLVSA